MKKADILNALTIVKPGLSNKEIIEQASSFAFMGGRIITYNDEISISHPIEGLEIEGAIKAEVLYGLLSKIKTEEISLEVNGNELLVTAGRTKAGITMQEKIILPLDEITEKTKWKTLPEKFSKFLKFSAEACSSDMSDPKLTCVNATKEGYLQSSDGFKVLVINLKQQMPIDTFLIPAVSSMVVAKLDPIKISQSEGWVHFKNESGTIISCRVFEETYPDIVRIINVEGIPVTFPTSLSKVLDRAGVFTKREHTIDESIEIILSNKRLTAKAVSDNGWFEESLNSAYDGEPISFSITPYLLKDILSQTLDCIIGKTKLRFETEDWLYVSILKQA